MEYNWCHGTNCHTNKTQDRIRGVKGSKVLRTRKIAQNNWNKNTVWSAFCSQGCWNDFKNEHWAEFMALHPITEALETPIDVVKKTVETFFVKNFNVDACILEIISDSELQNLENETALEMNKNTIHMGPLSKEKMISFFANDSIKSAVISVLKLKNSFGLLKIGSNESTKYLGDGDTTFIEYIRDMIISVLESKEV